MRFRGVPVDGETIPRSIRRKFSRRLPFSSYPLLTGDTFRAHTDYELRNSDLTDLPRLATSLEINSRIFVGAKPGSDMAFSLAERLSHYDIPIFREHELLIHNGDEIPSSSEFLVLSHHFKNIYSVNYLGGLPNVHPIPIGLENKNIFRNGVPRDFLFQPNSPSNKTIDFLFAFSLHTNVTERTQALNLAEKLPNSHVISEAITPKDYRILVSRSRYVISPPGNGVDCHRTWEALYLNSTPVVKRDFWPFSHLQLPVIIVDEWSDLSTMCLHKEPLSFGFPWSSIHVWLEVQK